MKIKDLAALMGISEDEVRAQLDKQDVIDVQLSEGKSKEDKEFGSVQPE